MKKIFFVALGATLLAAGCQKTEIINPVGNPIGFTTDLGKITKTAAPDADNDGYVNLDAQNFKVWSYYAYSEALNDIVFGTNYDGMKALDVAYVYNPDAETDALKHVCSTTKEYYWPGTGKDLDFFAVSTEKAWATTPTLEEKAPEAGVYVAFTNLTGANGAEVNPEARTMTVNNYVVDNGNPNDDLMVADFVRQNQGENGKAVALNFHHTLSKVEFLFTTSVGDDMRVLVQSVEVEGLNNAGTLNVTSAYPNGERPAKPETGEYEDAVIYPVTVTWPTTTGSVKFTDDYPTDYTAWKFGDGEDASKIELVGGKKVDPTATEGDYFDENFDKKAMALDATAKRFCTWLMIPQSVEGKTVTVTYIINNRQFKSVFALDKGLADKKWDVNQYIKYTVTLTPNMISFTPSVDVWKPATNVEHTN